MSCIYGLGSPEAYIGQSMEIKKGQKVNRQDLINDLIKIYYERNDYEANPGTFAIKGDSIEIRKSSTNERIIIDLWGDQVKQIVTTGLFSDKEDEINSVKVFPARHYVTEKDALTRIIPDVERDLKDRLKVLKSQGKLVEAQRLKQRVSYDLEMMQETGYVSGIENYSPLFSRTKRRRATRSSHRFL